MKNNQEPSLIIFMVVLILLITMMAFSLTANAAVIDNIDHTSWLSNVDYMGEIITILKNSPTQKEMELAEAYEALRNAKIDSLNLTNEKTYYFHLYGYNTADILYAIENPKVHTITALEEEVDLLARIIYLEAGQSSWIPRDILEMIGFVVVNRVNDSRWPDSVEGVLSQSGQFSTWSSRNRITPTDRCYEVARWCLENHNEYSWGDPCPTNLVYFANFTQGNGVYFTYVNPYGSNLYFCYG